MDSDDSIKLDMNYLFDEILIVIFDFLNLRTLKQCRLVCRRWDELISNSKSFPDKYKLAMKNYPDLDKIILIRRKPRNVLMSGILEFDPEFLTNFSNVHSLSLCTYLFGLKLTCLYEVLKTLPHLRVLSLVYNCLGNDIKNPDTFKKLDVNLVELHSDVDIVHIINCPTLKVLNLRYDCTFKQQNNIVFCEFISQQTKLEGLHLIGFEDDFFHNLQKYSFKFQLKTFSYYTYSNFLFHDELINLLEKHKHSLMNVKIETCSLDQCRRVTTKNLKYIMENLSNLRTLELKTKTRDFAKIHEIFTLPLAPFVANKIERFNFCDIFHSVNDTKHFIDMLPNVKHILIKSRFKRTSDFLDYAVTKPQLKSFKVSNFEIFRHSPFID